MGSASLTGHPLNPFGAIELQNPPASASRTGVAAVAEAAVGAHGSAAEGAVAAIGGGSRKAPSDFLGGGDKVSNALETFTAAHPCTADMSMNAAAVRVASSSAAS